MRVKRTTYATMAADDEVAKLSRDIKQVIHHLQEEIKKRQDHKRICKIDKKP